MSGSSREGMGPSFPLGTKPVCVETELLQGEETSLQGKVGTSCAAHSDVGIPTAVNKPVPQAQMLTEGSPLLSFWLFCSIKPNL